MPKNFTMQTSEDALKDNFAKLDKLKTFTVKELLSFFEKHKTENTVEKIHSIFHLVGVNLTSQEIVHNDYERHLRNYKSCQYTIYHRSERVEDTTRESYSINLWINRFLNWSNKKND